MTETHFPHSVVRYDGITFVDTLHPEWPITHTCLTKRQHKNFTEAIEMNFTDSENYSETSGGIPAGTDPDDDEDMPEAPTLTAATIPSAYPLPSRRPRIPVSLCHDNGSPIVAPVSLLASLVCHVDGFPSCLFF